MLACEVPQNCAHCPGVVPISLGVHHSSLLWLGMTSRLPPSRGSQKLCITSAEFNVKAAVWLTGMWTSLAVVTPRVGYWNSHHHWWPMTVMGREPCGGGACVLKMIGIVKYATTA